MKPTERDFEKARNLTMPFRDDVIRSPERMKTLQQGIAAALAKRSEECAGICERLSQQWVIYEDQDVALRCAAAIRKGESNEG